MIALLAMLGNLLLAAVSAVGDARQPDRVELADGTVVQGRVVCETESEVVVRVGTKERTIAVSELKSVYARLDNQREAIERWRALSVDDVDGALELGRFCQRHDLREELELIAWWILLRRPDDAEAHEFLEHEKTKLGWIVRDGPRRVEMSKYLKAHADWSDPFELRTTHYVVRTNLPMASAIEVAFDLECHYRAFFDLFARPVRVFEVTEPIAANVHADARSFPRQSSERTAFFQPLIRTLEVDASVRLDVRMLMHEATHALVDATAVSTRASKGVIPSWLDEGLAEYLAAGMNGEPGRLRFDADSVAREHFVTHAKARDPYDLSRLLNFEPTDFAASVRSDLKYAEAYSLVHFCLHGDRGEHRDAFHAFLRGCYAGQASQAHFKEALGLAAPQLERAWTTHVKAMSVQ